MGNVDFIDKPMKMWLQIATDDVDAHQVIGGRLGARCCNVKHRPPARAMRTNGCCCWAGCYGWTRPRTQLREDPHTTPRLRHGTPGTHGGHGHGRGRGAHAEVQLHGHHGQGRPYFGVSEAAGLSAKPSRLRLLPGHDQLVSAGIGGPAVGQELNAKLALLLAC